MSSSTPDPSQQTGPLTEERRFQRLVEAVTDYAIYMLDPRGHIVSWNSGAERAKGYQRSEVIGRHFSLFYGEDDRQRGLPQLALKTAAETGRFEAEGWRLRKDGTRFWANAVLDAVRDENGTLLGFAKVTRDLTERRMAELALIDSERRFRLLVGGIADYAIYMLDPSGIISNWNLGAKQLKQYSAAEIVGHHFSRFYTDEDRLQGVPARALATAEREGKFEAEGWRVRKDGSRFWAHVVIDAIRHDDGTLLGFAKITRDITERRAAQDALRQSERQFRLLVDNITDYAMYMLDPNGIVSSWNAGAQRIKGYLPAEVLGQHFSRFYTDPDRQTGMPTQALQTALREGRFEAEGWRVRKDGTHFWASVVIDPVRDEKGRHIGFAKITRDITERRETQLALQRAQEQLSQSQKMEALGQLTGGVAHDFNNILMVISGQADMLKLRLSEPKHLRAVEAIKLATARGESLTRQLLTFARRQQVKPVVIDLGQRVAALREMLASAARGNIEMVVDIPGGIWPVNVDLSEFELGLLNMALNARDAMPEGGILSFTARNERLADGSDVGLSGDFVALTMADTGTGIPPEVLNRVFDPFFTTKELGKGTGLGLSQVHGFAHQSGGTVRIWSEVGKGTRVTIYLPRSRGVPVSEGKDQPPAVRTLPAKILIVEDNPEVANVSAMLLDQLGYEITIVNSADAALGVLESESFDLVFSDIVMPGERDGIALAHEIRKRKPGLPVLLTSGYAKASEAVQKEFTILRKPYDINALGRTVAQLLEKSRKP
jgi:PAS domain S-box-containing protein